MTTSNQIDNNILSVIRELFESSGPQSFSEILSEVRSQSSVILSLSNSHEVTKTHLNYLVSLGSIIENNDEFGIVYGNIGDF